MITLGQIRLLEEKIETVITKIQNLEQENKVLVEKNNSLQKDKENLLFRISSFEADQEQIEKGILSALDKLNTMESAVIKESISNTLKNAEEQKTEEQKIETQKINTESYQKTSSESNLQVKPQETIQEQEKIQENAKENFIELNEEDIEIHIDDSETPSSEDETIEFDIF